MIIRKGGPCSCKPGRYVRFFIPPGVPGCTPVISCREVGAASDKDVHERDRVAYHGVPEDAELQVRVP